ncbi:hypothetical protein LOD55_05420 [Xylella fastidiosa subsp. multiplex]|uniref:hypothetical protein n=2 Tax=Xylella fastidiosa TaxID=2371 RepID=UPI0012AE857C|nr:hypothetical protein [Xylella fastidiosa]MDD0861092.1 hypothetical protein [Xylella fastidiosa subsp. multiplex]
MPCRPPEMSPSAAAAVFPQTLPRRTSRDRDWPRFRVFLRNCCDISRFPADAMPPEAIAAGRMAPCFYLFTLELRL